MSIKVEPMADGIVNLAHRNWLDQVGSAPLRLTAGQHTLRLTYAGRDPLRSTIIDAFLLSPAIVSQRFTGPDGGKLTLRYNMLKGTLAWEEE